MSEEFENLENSKGCTKKLLVTAVISNAVAILLMAICFVVLIFAVVLPQADGFELPKFKKDSNAVREFKGKTIPYQDAMQDNKYAAVLFYADWCPHCQRFSPKFEKLSKDRKLNKKFNFVRINVESEEALPLVEEYNVKGFPTLFLVNPRNGEAFWISNNLMSDDDAVKTLKDLFKSYAESRDKDLSEQ